MGGNRRKFLKQSVTVLGAVGVGACSELQRPPGDRSALTKLTPETLRAVADVTLPVGELRDDGRETVVLGFERWAAGFRPVAELEHPYLDSSDIRYGPPDPRPRWQSQLEALEIEANQEYSTPFAKLDRNIQRRIIERQIRGDRLERLPNPAEANHVAVALLAYFYGSPEANDLCYQARIERLACRGIETAPNKPAPKG